jgi:hypothetical protein
VINETSKLNVLGLSCDSASAAITVNEYVVVELTVELPDISPFADNAIPVGNVFPAAKV